MTIYDHSVGLLALFVVLFPSFSPFFVGALLVPFVVAVDHTQQTHTHNKRESEAGTTCN